MSPGRTAAILRRQLRVLWGSPLPWLSGAAMHLAIGYLAVDALQARQQAVFQPVVPIAGFVVLVVVPLLAARTVVEDRRTGTLDQLHLARVPMPAYVAASWSAVVVTSVALLAPLGVLVGLLAWWGDPDLGPVVAGALGLVLLAGLCAAVGLAASALAPSQGVASVSALVILLGSWFLRPTAEAEALRTVTARLSTSERLRGFAGGGIALGDVAFLLGGVLLALLVASVTLAPAWWRRPRVIAVAGALAICGVVTQLALEESGRTIDLTAERTLTLSRPTQELLAQLDDEVRITAFVAADTPGRDEVVALLDRFEDASRRIRADVRDPADVPGEVARLGVDPVLGGVVLESALGDTTVPFALEADLALGIARLLRGSLPTVCLTAGHGELDSISTLPNGFANGARVLADAGFPLREVDLLAGGIPEGCGVVLVVGAVSPLRGDAEVLARFLADDGRLGLFLEPGFETGLEEIAAATGIEVLPGLVFESDPASAFEGDPTAPLLRRYSSASPVVRNLPPTFLVTAGGLAPSDRSDRLVLPLAETSPDSVLVADDPAGGEAPIVIDGPIVVAATSERAANDGGVRRQRLAVVADADVVANGAIGTAGNARLLVQLVDWLAVDDDLVSVSSNLADPRPLAMTPARRDYARTLTMVVVPGALLLAYASLAVLRRRR